MSKKLLFNFNREVIQNYTYVKYAGTIITATNTLEKPIKSAILKGSTKYRDIDTGEILEAFEEGRNLELVSVKMPVLTTYTNLFTGFITKGYIEKNGQHVGATSDPNLLSDYIEIFGKHLAFRRFKKDGTPVNSFGEFAFYDADKNFIDRRIKKQNVDESVTVPENTKYIRIWSRPTNDGIDEIAMLIHSKEKPSTITEYQPCKTNILTVNEDVTLRGIEGVHDELNLLTGEVVGCIGRVVLDGSENWSVNNSNNGGFYSASTTTYIGKPNGAIISDKLPTTTTTKDEGVMMGVSTGKVMVSFNRDSTGVTNLNSFVEKLAQNPITILYELETESIKTVDLSILDQNENKVSSISSFNDTTHITASSETIPPIFEGYLATKEVE